MIRHPNFSAETIAAAKEALAKAIPGLVPEDLIKAWTQSGSATSGITAYDLEAPAKSLVPVITPLRNRISRVGGGMGIQANWRAVTGVNINKLGIGVGEGQRSVVQTVSTADYTAPFSTIGLEDYVTFEAELAAQGFDDVKALATLNLLRATFIGEEKLILGGNRTTALGTTPTPSAAASTSGGSLGDATYSVICVALTLEAYLACDLTLASATAVPVSGSRTLADGTTQNYKAGTAIKSAAGTAAVSGGSGNGSVSASVAVVNGAAAYAWFWGTSGNEVLGAITTINSVKITAAGAGSQTPAAFTADNSQNTLVFDGLLGQIVISGSNSYIKTMATGTAGTGTPLTADGKGGISEIDDALKSFWDNYRLSPTDIYVSSQEQKNISDKILQGGVNTSQRMVITVDQANVKGGYMVRSYLNKYAMDGAKDIPIHLHPNMPPGTIMFYSDSIPYPLSNVVNVVQVKTRRDYYQLEWPIRTRRYEYGVYSDEVLQNYFPPAFGIIRNIANG